MPYHLRMPLPLSKDDQVEVAATFSGSMILGASFAKELFMRGNFELRIFLFGLSSIVLFCIVAYIAKIRMRVFDPTKKMLSIGWMLLFLLGTLSAVNLFNDQLMLTKMEANIREEALFFILCYTLSTDTLFLLNQDQLEDSLRRKTAFKYLLAPINGMGMGAILSWLLMWWTGRS